MYYLKFMYINLLREKVNLLSISDIRLDYPELYFEFYTI